MHQHAVAEGPGPKPAVRTAASAGPAFQGQQVWSHIAAVIRGVLEKDLQLRVAGFKVKHS